VIFVRQVVAVRHVVADERSEIPVDHDLFARAERDRVFLGEGVVGAERPDRCDVHTILSDDPVLLLMEVHRMDPAAAAVLDRPYFWFSPLRERERRAHVERPVVDRPLEFAREGLRHRVGKEIVETAASLQLERLVRKAVDRGEVDRRQVAQNPR